MGYGDICPSDKATPLGKAFIVALSARINMWTHMNLASSWRARIRGGMLSTGMAAIAFGTLLFVCIEDMDWHEAIYCAFISGTTIGYGDMSPTSDFGKLAGSGFVVSTIYIMVCFVLTICCF